MKFELYPHDDEKFNKIKEITNNSLHARILESRIEIDELEDILFPKKDLILEQLEDTKLTNAANILQTSIENNERIVFVTDSDCDGQSSAAISNIYFEDYINYPHELILNKRKDGNGVNEVITQEIIDKHNEKPIGLIITADHGSHDEPRFKRLKELGIKIIVTDHHEFSLDGLPVSVDEVVNPQDSSSTLNKRICGCSVLYLLLLKHWRMKNSNGFLNKLLFINALATVVDQMSLREPINRLFFKLGMEYKYNIPFTKIYEKRKGTVIDGKAIDLSMGIGPLINSCKRLDKPHVGYNALISDEENGEDNVERLFDMNTLRVNRQNELMNEALDYMNMDRKQHSSSLCVITRDSGGIGGILAGKFGKQCNVPTFVFSLDKDGLLSGSGRSINNKFDIDLFVKHLITNTNVNVINGGGHKAAGGVQIHKDDFKLFRQELEKFAEPTISGDNIIHYDDELKIKHLSETLADMISELEPYGNGFPIPVFKVKATIAKRVKYGLSDIYRFIIKDEDGRHKETMYFDKTNIKPKDNITLYMNINNGYYKGKRSLNLITLYIEE